MHGDEPQADIVGIGYEGRSIDEFLRGLTHLDVYALVDVRLTPISRKPGFSKGALAAGVESAGVRYEHLRALGNPKSNRAGFAGSMGALTDAQARYRVVLGDETAEQALDRIGELSERGRVALLCFEADERRCHRQVLLQVLGGRRSDT